MKKMLQTDPMLRATAGEALEILLVADSSFAPPPRGAVLDMAAIDPGAAHQV